MADDTDTTNTSVAAAAMTPATAAAGAPAKGAKGALFAKTSDAVEPELGSYTVAPGRTLIDDNGEAKKPGDTAQLSAKDAKRMLDLGFILDTDGSIVIRADGPAVNVVDGVQIAQPA